MTFFSKPPFFLAAKSGSVGVIHVVENEADVEWLEVNGTAAPYMVVLSFDMFTIKTLKRLKNSNKVSGVLLIKTNSEKPSYYSPDDSCPNRYSGYKSCDPAEPWNPHGSSLLLEDWPFPMFYIQVRMYYLLSNGIRNKDILMK